MHKWKTTTINYKKAAGLIYDPAAKTLTLADGVKLLNVPNATEGFGRDTDN